MIYGPCTAMEYIARPIEPQKKLAVLIDADNAQPGIIKGLLDEVAKYGTANVKRIYGNWTTPQLQGWKETLLKHSIHPIQQFNYTDGKNATDSAMIIDAMDILYTEKMDGFCIVSSDSDFTRLASRIRESGLTVYGFGEKKTPKPFVEACDKFLYTEILRPVPEDTNTASIQKAERPTKNELLQNKELIRLLTESIEDSSGEDGWAHLGLVGQNIQKKAPDFDSRNYDFKKLGDLVKSIDLFETQEKDLKSSGSKTIYVRIKSR